MPTTREAPKKVQRRMKGVAKFAEKRGAKRPAPERQPAPAMITFDPMHDNPFEAMGLPDAPERVAKAEMARAIAFIVHERGWNQKRTADALAIAASDVSDLIRGKLARFSQERLVRFLNALGMDVHIVIGPRPEGKIRADVTVERVASFRAAS